MCSYWRIMIVLLIWWVVGNPYMKAEEPVQLQASNATEHAYSMTVSKASLANVVEAISRSYKIDILGINTLYPFSL